MRFGPIRGVCLACMFAAVVATAADVLPPPAARLDALGGRQEGQVLALQICLDRRGFSVNTLDGQAGRKTQVALATYLAVNRPTLAGLVTPQTAWKVLFPEESDLFRTETVSETDHAALVEMPSTPEEKAKLVRMGYATLQEMYAERGHLSEPMLRRLNPTLAWPNPPAGSRIVLPDLQRPRSALTPTCSRRRPDGVADVLRVSLSRLEITVFDEHGTLIALFPCSIAADKNKLPPAGEIQVKTVVADPNYTYTAPTLGPQGRITRYIFPPGPNNPVGSAWIGLTLPTYGIHGTPTPARIGNAESHGCFRLANWNAVRLRRMCDPGTSVVIVP